MTPAEMRTELIHVAAEMVRGLHGDDIVFSKTTPWYVRARVEKVIDTADERSKVLAMRLKKVADALIERPSLETPVDDPVVCPDCGAQKDGKGEREHEAGCPWFERKWQSENR